MGLPPEVEEVLGELRTRWPWVAGFALVVFLIALAIRCGSAGDESGVSRVEPREPEKPALSQTVLVDRPFGDRDYEDDADLPAPERMPLPRAVTDPLLPGPRDYRLDEDEYGDNPRPGASGGSGAPAAVEPARPSRPEPEEDEMHRILEGGGQ